MESDRSTENDMIREAVRGWTRKACPREAARHWDEAGSIPSDLFAGLAALGFCAMLVPESYGGQGRNVPGACIVLEELAYATPALASLYAGAALYGGEVLSRWGSLEQKEARLKGCGLGECLVAPVLDDPDAGAGTCLIGTEARQENGHFLMTGETAAIPAAGLADLFLVLAKTGEDRLTMFCVEAGRAGMQVTAGDTLGYRGAALGRLSLDAVRASSADILGGPTMLGQGRDPWAYVRGLSALQGAAQGVGIARAAFDYALEHARQRIQFNQPIGKFMAIRHLFARNATLIEAARLLVCKAASRADQGDPFSHEAAMAKCLSQEAAKGAAFDGLQVLGGYGYTLEYDAQRHVRDAVGLNFIGGTSDGLKGLIGDSFQI